MRALPPGSLSCLRKAPLSPFLSFPQVGLDFESYAHPTAIQCCATGEPETPELRQGARSRDFTEPLRPFEEHRPSFRWGVW